MDISLRPLDQQVIVITGASSGIGLATATLAFRRGARVAMLARSGDTLQQLARRLEQGQGGGRALAIAVDVAEREQVQAAAKRAVDELGRIDTWINNAGVSVYGRLHEVSDDDHRRLFDTNFWGVVHGSLAALPWLRREGGALINVGSEASDVPVPLQGMYSASKHAVKGFTDALRIELEADEAPVSVTLVQPTAVDTPFAEHAANYLSQAPRLPTPMIDPFKVAEAILGAATRPTRHVRVGAMARLNVALSAVAPRVFDAMARKQLGRQQRDEPARSRSGSLYQPCGGGSVRGRGDENAADREEAFESNVRRDGESATSP